jgi:ArsR family transcriptional regulator
MSICGSSNHQNQGHKCLALCPLDIYGYPHIKICISNTVEDMMKSENYYKCLANATRLRCLMLLLAREELCVCDIVDALGVSQPMISRHLAQLRACDLVSDQRKGQWMYYRLHKALPSWQHKVLATTQDGLQAQAPYTDDLLRLEAIERQKQAGDCC